MAEAAWSLSAEERGATVERITKNISSIAFFKGHEISDADARAAAVAAEKKAYTAAQVAARTTTGNRPHAETTSGYARSAQLSIARSSCVSCKGVCAAVL
jgi:large subunit ribosomal protein L31/Ran GTPase-activating protein 1